MLLKTIKNNWITIKTIAIVLAIIPLIYTTYKIAGTDKNSIVIFENTSSIISLPILLFYFILYASIAAYGIYWVIKQVKKVITLKTEKAKTELMLLKSQVNPHFFFNMLNNLYGLVGKDPKKGQELILKLSDMMRYSIYEGEREMVTLIEEVDYLKNYIELHKMRYHKEININFKYEIEENYKVMPLLFIILLENAFKHGVERLRDSAFVNVNMITFKDELQFTVENNFDNSESIEEPGIGLKNLKRRLELVYPNRHKLLFSVVENVYKVELILK
jgi:two-component system sensor histidine kinase AlgZ